MNLVLFDLDNTLLSGDSDYEWMQFLIAKGAVDGETYRVRNQHFYALYQEGQLDIDEFLEFQFKPLTQHSRQQLDRWRREFVSECICPLISREARELVASHQKNGDLCALVTATHAFITGLIGRELEIAHLIATIPAQEKGVCTGRARGVPAFREGKVIRVEAWLESFGLDWSDFENIWFYSDSLNDLPLLEKVSRPVAVKPDPVLRAHAKKRGWPIIELEHTGVEA